MTFTTIDEIIEHYSKPKEGEHVGNKLIEEACNEAFLMLENGQINGIKSEIRDVVTENVKLFKGTGINAKDILHMTRIKVLKEFGNL